jgi:CheY-like chemotaxis protein
MPESIGPSLSPSRILIVDDNKDAALSLAFLLSAAGYDVVVAHEGLTALEDARRFLPQVILLDIGLPQMDGYEVARRLRADPAFSKVPIIAITGFGQDEDRIRSRVAGFDFHFVKPIDPHFLQILLKTLRVQSESLPVSYSSTSSP